MTYKTISAKKLTPSIGAEISGVDLSQNISDQVSISLYLVVSIFSESCGMGVSKVGRFIISLMHQVCSSFFN